MILLALSLAVLVATGLLAAALVRPRRAALVGASGAVAGCALALSASAAYFLGFDLEPLEGGGGMGAAVLALSVDGLSAFFLVPLALVGAAAAAFAVPYLRAHAPGRPAGPALLWFNTLLAAMVAVLCARNGVTFLIAWETVALVSFFLVLFDGDRPEVRAAAWTYFVASQAGTAVVVAFFAAAAATKGSVDFRVLATAAPPEAGRALALFALAVVGFGTKAGLVPFHVWLPEAHPVAPAHASALMSGAMVNLGMYGVMRALTFVGPPALSWGWALVALGAASGIVGALYALGQRDLKRVLAYSTVDNMGLAALGLAVGVLGSAAGAPAVAGLGYAGTLVHLLAHSLAKGQLFLAAGALSASAHRTDLEELGGALKRMPRTGACAFIGSASLAGLPPFGGFVGEFLILAGAVAAAASLPAAYAVPAAVAAGALACTGALAAGVFVRAFGAAFLGQARSEAASRAAEGARAMVWPQVGLAGSAAALGLLAPAALDLAAPGAQLLVGPSPSAGGALAGAAAMLAALSQLLAALLVLAAGLAFARHALEARAARAAAPTWDCGYAAPTARMQYSASSFSLPASRFFARLAPRRIAEPVIEGLFPAPRPLSETAPDAFLDGGYATAGAGLRRVLRSVLRLQNGRIQAYVLYVVAALVAVLLWRLV